MVRQVKLCWAKLKKRVDEADRSYRHEQSWDGIKMMKVAERRMDLGVRSGYVREWLAEQKVLCYRVNDLTVQTIDVWAADLTHELMSWPSEKPWRLLLDIRFRGSIVNPYALRRARGIAGLRPELPGRLSVLVASPLVASTISFAIRTTTNTYRQRAVFVDEALALRWLLEAN